MTVIYNDTEYIIIQNSSFITMCRGNALMKCTVDEYNELVAKSMSIRDIWLELIKGTAEGRYGNYVKKSKDFPLENKYR